MIWWRIATVSAFALDLLTTWWAFALGAIEANPFLSNLDFHWIVVAKGGVLMAVLWFARKGKMAKVVHGYGAGITGSVAAWNLCQILIHGI